MKSIFSKTIITAGAAAPCGLKPLPRLRRLNPKPETSNRKKTPTRIQKTVQVPPSSYQMINTPQRIPAAELPAGEWDETHERQAFFLVEKRVFTKCQRILGEPNLAAEAAGAALIRVFRYYNPAQGRQKFSPEVRLLIFASRLARQAAWQLLRKENRHRELGKRLLAAQEPVNARRREEEVGLMFDEPEPEEILGFDPVAEGLARRAAAMATFADQAEAVLRRPDPGVLPPHVEEQIQLCLHTWREFHFPSGLDVEALVRRGLALAASLCKPSKNQDPCPLIFRCVAARWRLAGSPKPWKEVAALILAETGIIVEPNTALVRVKRIAEQMKKVLLRS